MSARLAPVVVLVAWVGATLVLSCSRRLRRTTLVERLAPYQPVGEGGTPLRASTGPAAGGPLEPWRRLLEPTAARTAERLAAVLGTSAHLEQRLARAGWPVDPVHFRSRQAVVTVLGAVAAGVAAAAVGMPPVVGLAVATAVGAAGFLVVEQRLVEAVARRQEQFRLELPIVAEQLGMLLGAGWSLGSAMNRLAARGQGVVAEELAVVCARIRHGLAEGDALAEWAERTELPALGRLVDVLALDRHTSDVGRLIAEEARAMRRDAHRRLLEQIERRSQTVWVPVTLAALVPGLLFLAVPFVDALRLFSAG